MRNVLLSVALCVSVYVPVCVSVIAAGGISVPVAASAPPGKVILDDFKLDKTEAARGERVVARWSFTGQARRVALVAFTPDGTFLPYRWPALPASNGAITFTVPLSLYTLSPMVVSLSVDGHILDSAQLLITCDNPWFFAPRPERCPSVPIKPTAAAMQVFEHGLMFWLQDRDAIFVMYDTGIASTEAGRWETFIDNFEEGSAETDPAIVPPTERQQPRRGFGLLWRTQPRVRETLGWALAPERGYTACVGGGFGGWKSYRSYMNDADNRILELDSYYMPTTWRPYEAGGDAGVVFTGCEDHRGK